MLNVEIDPTSTILVFSAAFLCLTIYNDVVNYRAAVTAGKHGLINCAFGTGLVLIGAPIYFFYRARQKNLQRMEGAL